MTTLLPLDGANHVIPAIRLKSSGAHSIAATASSACNTTAFADDTQIISLYATVPVYIKFGTSGVSATSSDHYFPAGIYYDLSVGGGAVSHYTHLAVLRVGSEDGMVYISEKE